MNKTHIIEHLVVVANAKREWAKAQTQFNSGVNAVMARLLHEAAVARMSPEMVANTSGFTVKRIRSMMREVGLNPRDGKGMLSARAAAALESNAALMGVEPKDMDLLSPLAYLPMGGQLKRALAAAAVDEANQPEVSGNIALTDDEYDLAMKLADAGPTGEEAVEWVQRILAARGVQA